MFGIIDHLIIKKGENLFSCYTKFLTLSLIPHKSPHIHSNAKEIMVGTHYRTSDKLLQH